MPAKTTPGARGVPDTLSDRQLNRATLARQLLLVRKKAGVLPAFKQLLGLQAQLARPPYLALWARLAGFKRDDLTTLVESRALVRATWARATIHLLSADDYVQFRPVVQPMLTAGFTSVFRKSTSTFDLNDVVAFARAFFTAEPRTFDEFRTAVLEKWPTHNERELGYAVRMHLPLVQVPGESTWGYPAKADFACADAFIGRSIAPEGVDASSLVLRYLEAFGPASIADAQAWSGVRGLRATFDALAPQLRRFRSERGTELFDLPDAPRPKDDVEAPVRLLGDFDNVILGYADRGRIVDDEHKQHIITKNLLVPPVVLVDGRVAGSWKIERTKTLARLRIAPFVRLTKAVQRALETEGEALGRFVEPDSAGIDVSISSPGTA